MVAAYENSIRDRRLKRIYNLHDFECRARKLLPRALAEYVFGGVEDNVTLANNRHQFDDHSLLTGVLRDVSQRHTQHTVFGKSYAAPFGIAPIGVSALIAFNGDNVLASAAYNLGIPMILSGSSLTRLEEVKQHHPNVWFQAYLPGDADLQAALIERVAAAGIDTLVITVDIPVWANRENNMRAGFSLPLRPSLSLLVMACCTRVGVWARFGPRCKAKACRILKTRLPPAAHLCFLRQRCATPQGGITSIGCTSSAYAGFGQENSSSKGCCQSPMQG